MKRIILLLIILLSLSACSFPGLRSSSNKNDVTIASGNTTERQIMAEMISQMITHYDEDINVSILSNLGSSILVHQAMLRNDANISSVMYTGTSLTGELGLKATTDTEKAFWSVVDGFNQEFNLVWFPSYGFENTYAFMVAKEFAELNNLEKVSDLEKIADNLNVGIDTAWLDREGDGYEAFKEIYGFEFSNIAPMEISLVYKAIQTKDMDLVLGYSTDGRIDAYDLIVLEDDLNLFPPYDASLVASKELLEENPKLESILLKLENSIIPSDMQSLNRRSDEDKLEPRNVAKEFLEENNYFEGINRDPLKTRDKYKDILGGK